MLRPVLVLLTSLALSTMFSPSALGEGLDIAIRIHSAHLSVAPEARFFIHGWIGALNGDAGQDQFDVQLRVPDAFSYAPSSDTPAGSLGWTCAREDGFLICQRDLRSGTFGLELIAPFETATPTFAGRASVAAPNDPDVSNNTVEFILALNGSFVVSHDGDSGEGSLRRGIEQANKHCTGVPRCEIVFDLATPSTRIEVLTPLPAITAAQLTIEPRGFRYQSPPAVELNGSRLAAGNGLVFRSTSTQVFSHVLVQGMAINGFPENGVVISHVLSPDSSSGQYSFAGVHIGTDLTGTRAIPNGLRGLSIDDRRYKVAIVDSVISGNARSGIFMWAAGPVFIGHTKIGTARNGTDPLPNGAAGIFVGEASGVAVRTIEYTTIAYNQGPGIAAQRHTAILSEWQNKIHDNAGPDVDWGLDGPTLHETEGIPPTPVLTSARYDSATNTTIVYGHFGAQARQGIQFWPAERMNQFGSTPLIRQISQPIHVVEGTNVFFAHLPGDFRGNFISAVALVGLGAGAIASSEPSLAVPVQEPPFRRRAARR